MIRVQDICKQFRRNEKHGLTEFLAVDHVSFDANKGEILGILGPNGAGKTTLLRMLGGLMKPTSGTVTYYAEDGKELTEANAIKNNIGYLSGNTKLYHRFSVREFLDITGEIYGMTKAQRIQRIDEIEKILNMSSFIDNRIGKLSTGQTQRANISRCLIHNPEVYIFDEPTLGLDILSSEAIIEFMKSERENNKLILYSTHYMEEAQYLCDRIIMMYYGKIITIGTPHEIMEKTNTDNLRDAFKAIITGSEAENVSEADVDISAEVNNVSEADNVE